MRMSYRIQQFFNVFTKHPVEAGLTQVRSFLSPDLMTLFEGMHPSEQAHSIEIFHQLQADSETNTDLLVAALLHDVGKSRHPLNVWERTAIVIGKAFFPKKALQWGKGSPVGWKRPFVVANYHAAWGAEMAAKAGASQLAVNIIKRHQDAPSPASNDNLEELYLQRLQVLDNEY